MLSFDISNAHATAGDAAAGKVEAEEGLEAAGCVAEDAGGVVEDEAGDEAGEPENLLDAASRRNFLALPPNIPNAKAQKGFFNKPSLRPKSRLAKPLFQRLIRIFTTLISNIPIQPSFANIFNNACLRY